MNMVYYFVSPPGDIFYSETQNPQSFQTYFCNGQSAINTFSGFSSACIFGAALIQVSPEHAFQMGWPV